MYLRCAVPAGVLLGGGRDAEAQRRVPRRVAAAVGVRRGALARHGVAGDGGHGVHLEARHEVDVLEVPGRLEGHLQHPVRHASCLAGGWSSLTLGCSKLDRWLQLVRSA